MPGRRHGLLAAGLGAALVGVVVAIAGAPVAWWLLGICAVLCLVVLAPAWRTGRFLEPLPMIAAVAALMFVIRPFYLFLHSKDLLSWYPTSSPLDALIHIEHSDVALFATTRMLGSLQPALTRAIGSCVLFLAVLIAAYSLPAGKRLTGRVSRLGRRTSGLNVPASVAVSLAIGFVGQAAIVLKAGGLGATVDNQIEQRALQAGLALFILAGFAVAGVIVWAAWHKPTRQAEWVAFCAVVLEVCAFYALVGARTGVLAVVLTLVVVAHYRWRALPGRYVALGCVGLLLVATAMLGVRQATATEPFGRALGSAPVYIVHPRGVVNDVTEFDQLFVATSVIGPTLPYKHGSWLVEAFHSYVPHFIDPHKPPPSDVVFRREVYGNSVGAGRPPTAIGDFYYDFGLAGVAIGALVLGLLARALLMLLAPGGPEGRAYRVAIYALGLFIIYEIVTTTYSVAIGFVLTLGVPLLIAIHGLGRLPRRARRSPAAGRGPSTAARAHVRS